VCRIAFSRRAVGFTEDSAAEPDERRNAALNNFDLWLTAEEFHRVAEELSAVIAPYRKRTRSAGSRRVRVMKLVVPHQRAQVGRNL
jgi:hypothetical protein